jgi:hypothetical protein
MKALLPLVKSYVQNSLRIIEDLKHLYISENALLSSADAVSMYTNTDTELGIAVTDTQLRNRISVTSIS